MVKKIAFNLFILFSVLTFSQPEIVYDEETNKPLNGYVEYIKKDTNIKVLEEDYVEGIKVEERNYYESGGIKKITKYDEGEKYLEKEFFEDGELSSKIIYKDGVGRLLVSKDEGNNSIFSEDGRIDRQSIMYDIEKVYYRGEDIFSGMSYDELYQKIDEKESKEEKIVEGPLSITRKYRYGILEKENIVEVEEGIYKESEKKLEEGNILSVYEEVTIYKDLPIIKEDVKKISYFPNGNKKREEIEVRKEEGKRYEIERIYDESEKLLQEKKYVNNDLKDTFIDKGYEDYKEKVNKSEGYKIKYPDGKIAYEKYSKDGKDIERYFNKKGILVFDKETSKELYQAKVRRMADESYDETVVKKPQNMKKYRDDGTLFYEERFEDNKDATVFLIVSYYKNGNINFKEKETIEKSNDTRKKRIYELEEYDENGNIIRSIYHDDKKHSKKFYGDNHKLKYEEILEDNKGEVISKNISYYKNGKIKRDSEMIMPNYSSSIKSHTKLYDINGELKKEYN